MERPDFEKGRKQIHASLPDLSKPMISHTQSFASSCDGSTTADKTSKTAEDDLASAPLFDSQKASEFFNIILDKTKEFQGVAV